MTRNPSPTPAIVRIGGYALALSDPSRAGRFGCDPCFVCGTRPAHGDLVRFTCYADLVCEACAVPVEKTR